MDEESASEIYESFYVQLLLEPQSSQPVFVCHVTTISLCCAMLRSNHTRLPKNECHGTFSNHTKTQIQKDAFAAMGIYSLSSLGDES